MKKVLLLLLVIALGVGSFFYGKYTGAELVRNGLSANFPITKQLFTGALTEVDSTLQLTVNRQDYPALFDATKTIGDTAKLVIAYHARYGIDLYVRFYKFQRDGNTLEAYMPKVRLFDNYNKLDEFSINSKTLCQFNFDEAGRKTLRTALNEVTNYYLEKDKIHINKASRRLTEVIMYYFMPYKFDLKIYYDNVEYPLPSVPGITQSVEEYVKQQVGK